MTPTTTSSKLTVINTNSETEKGVLLKLRMMLIEMLAGDEPIALNWIINPSLVKDGGAAIYVPLPKYKIKMSELICKGVLTPKRNCI